MPLAGGLKQLPMLNDHRTKLYLNARRQMTANIIHLSSQPALT